MGVIFRNYLSANFKTQAFINTIPPEGRGLTTYFIFIVPCIVIFYGITNRCHNVQ